LFNKKSEKGVIKCAAPDDHFVHLCFVVLYTGVEMDVLSSYFIIVVIIVLFYISEVINEARDFILELERRNEIHTATVAHVFSPVSITLSGK
jgi:hypothetical protein